MHSAYQVLYQALNRGCVSSSSPQPYDRVVGRTARFRDEVHEPWLQGRNSKAKIWVWIWLTLKPKFLTTVTTSTQDLEKAKTLLPIVNQLTPLLTSRKPNIYGFDVIKCCKYSKLPHQKSLQKGVKRVKFGLKTLV